MQELKSWKHFFEAIANGSKKHDVRSLKDRSYKVGEVLLLKEYDPFEGTYTGREQKVRVTFITSRDTPCAFSSGGLDPNLAILSLELVNDTV
jgi:hypothetical protein